MTFSHGRSWMICPDCSGEGHHCKHLGAYSREQFEHEFSYEEQEDYFAGRYDRSCDMCRGTGKVMTQGYVCPRCGNADEKMIAPDRDGALLCLAQEEEVPCEELWNPEEPERAASARAHRDPDPYSFDY